MLLHSILDFIFPRFCEICKKRLEIEENVICTSCLECLPKTKWWINERPTKKKYRPDDNIFQEEENKELILDVSEWKEKDRKQLFEENILAQKYWGRVTVTRAMSFLKFAPKTQTANLVYAFKYEQKDDVARFMGKMMGQELGNVGFYEGIDYIVPVPLTLKREMTRGYNQCTELAKGISSITGIKIAERILKRTHFKKSQTKLDGIARKTNIEGAFALDKKAGLVANSHILLVDDIITTGATTIECCKVLQKIQGIRISILSLGIVSL